jgi:uncharacterized protein (TIGR00369 family)
MTRPTGLRGEQPFIVSVPERLFRVQSVNVDADGRVTAQMRTGRWLALAAEQSGLAGSLGVLVDDVIGYVIIAAGNSWSVSTDIAIEMVGEVPTDGQLLRCAGRVLSLDAVGALSRGTVRTASEDVLAYCWQRARFVTRTPAGSAVAGTADTEPPPDPESLPDLLKQSVEPGPSWLDVVVTPQLVNPLGNLHGGMSLCLADWVASLVMPRPSRTASIRVQYVRPLGLMAKARFTAEIEHQGRSLGVVRVVVRDERGKICSIGNVVRH